MNEGEPYRDYAKIVSRFLIRAKPHVVSCELRDQLAQPTGLGYISIPDVSDTLGIIGATIKHKAPALLFPDANKHTIELGRLIAWAEKNGYRVDADDEIVRMESIS